jgi:putative chitinase
LTKENLNYSAKGLMGIFKKYFPTEALAKQYERKPEKIANKVYGNRMGNGPEASGEGAKFCGRG